MLFIWKKKGLLVPLAMFLGFLPLMAMAGTGTIGQTENQPASLIFKFIILISIFLPATLNFLFTKYFLKNEGVLNLTDEEGNQYQINNVSTFFFIKNKTWTIILLAMPFISLISLLFQ